jgi:pyruvate/2-oxoglutarate dehydrogenase complex dihydrolipoamide dehydrogenase (E3) component
MEQRYDVCIIGAGTAGFAAAQAARAAGRRMVVVSGPGDLGGTCILRGCMPAKTLLSSTERLRDVDSATEVGIELEPPRVDVPAIIERKRQLVDYFSEDRVRELEQFDLVRGCARFVAHDAIEVGDRRISAERFIIATGSRIEAPPIPGLRETGYLTSDDILELTTIPASVAIIGGGPVGCEFAQYFARLGAQVLLLEEGDQLLRNEDRAVADAIADALVADGIDVRRGVSIEHCAAAGDAAVITFSAGDVVTSRRVATLLLATGRVPNIAGLGLDLAGIVAGNGTIAVDPYLRTTNERVFVAGDVVGRRCLVHLAAYTGALALENAFAEQPRRAEFDRFEAHAVYTQPQVAVAGLTERVCRERGLRVRVERHPFSEVGKAVVSAHEEGFVSMIADDGGRVLGVAIVGVDAIDLIGEAIALIDHGATVAEIAAMPHLHPTMGEIFGRVAEDFMVPAAPASERPAA